MRSAACAGTLFVVAAVSNVSDGTAIICEVLAGLIGAAAVSNVSDGTTVICEVFAGSCILAAVGDAANGTIFGEIKADLFTTRTGSTRDDGLGVGVGAKTVACFVAIAVGIGGVLLDARRCIYAGIVRKAGNAVAAIRTIVAGLVASDTGTSALHAIA